MKQLLFLLLLLPGAGVAIAQAPTDPRPALRLALAAAPTDTARGRLAWALSEESESSADMVAYARQAIGLLTPALAAATGAGRRRLLRLLGAAVNNLGVGFSNGGDDRRAEPYYRRAAALRAAGGDVRGQIESLWNLGNTCEDRSDFANALRYYEQGVAAGRGAPAARSQVAQCLTSLGSVHSILGDARVALRYQLRALAVLEQGGEPLVLLSSLNQLASAYFNDYHDTARAEAYARRAQALAARTPRATDGLALALMLRGDIARERHQWAAARALLLQARALALPDHDPLRLSEINNALALVEEQAGHLPLALAYVRQSAAFGNRNALSLKCDTEELLARLLEKTGQAPAALAHLHRYLALRDSTSNEANQKATLQQRYARQEAALRATQARHQAVAAAEIRRQKQQRTAALVGVGLLLLLAAGLFNRFRFQRRATAAITREKARSDGLLRNILPAEVAAELMDTGKTTARHFDVVTVLFADVVGFTQLSETLTPQVLVATLDTYFGAFDAITGRFGLEKIKTIGDAYMLAGGLGQGLAADPAPVVRAALEMLRVVETLRAERESLGLPCFTLRVGLHTGPVVAGVVGVRKFAYDIWGDTVNTAARMESAGVGGRVNVSESTHALLAGRFVCVPRGKLAAKHKSEMEMYFVEGEAE